MPGFMSDFKNPPVYSGGQFMSKGQRTRNTFSRIRARAGRSVANRRVAQIANKTTTNRAEKKHAHLSIDENANIHQNGTILKLSAIGTSTDSHDRIGSYARPISLVMRWAMNPGSPNFTLVRMIIFQYHENDDGNAPGSADVLENVLIDSNNQLFSPYRQDSNNTRVLWDKMSWVAGETGSSQRVLTGKVVIPQSKIKQLRFDRGTVTSGSEMLYLLLISSRLVTDSDPVKPNFIAISNIRFTDL